MNLEARERSGYGGGPDAGDGAPGGGEVVQLDDLATGEAASAAAMAVRSVAARPMAARHPAAAAMAARKGAIVGARWTRNSVARRAGEAHD